MDSKRASVQAQYEQYPYPHRNPEDEKRQSVVCPPDSLDWINFYCFGGQKDFSKGFRALVAGGGTGDAAIFLASQLQDTDAEIVYLDISEPSMEVAKARAEVRGLNNITWRKGSLLDLKSLELGTFDYINCSGVLHHLEDPLKGLKSLKSVLKKTGALSLMVYGTYGRTAVYQIQELMRLIEGEDTPAQEKVGDCRQVINSLSPFHWYTLRGGKKTAENLDEDAAIYDLFLHSQDRAYTVPQLYEWIEKAGLHMGMLLPSDNVREGNLLYEPTTYIQNPALQEKIRKLDKSRQQAIAELLNGQIAKHTFYAHKQPYAQPTFENTELVPFFSPLTFSATAYQDILQKVKQSEDGWVTLERPHNLPGIKFRKTPHAEAFFTYMDGQRTIDAILDKVREEAANAPDKAALLQEFGRIFNALRIHNWVFLKAEGLPDYHTPGELQRRVVERYRISA